MWIDMPQEFPWQVYGQIDDSRLSSRVATDRPRPGLSSRTEEPRSVITGYLGERMDSTLMQEAIVTWPRKTQEATGPWACNPTPSLPGAKTLDVAPPTACYLLGRLAQGCAAASQSWPLWRPPAPTFF
eukprot:9474081-Pyramimonas_sp.AAC.1